MHRTTSERTRQTRKLWSKQRALFNVYLICFEHDRYEHNVSSPVIRLSYICLLLCRIATHKAGQRWMCIVHNVVHKNTNNRCKLCAFTGCCLPLRSFFPRFSPCHHAHSTRALYSDVIHGRHRLECCQEVDAQYSVVQPLCGQNGYCVLRAVCSRYTVESVELLNVCVCGWTASAIMMTEEHPRFNDTEQKKKN